MQQYFDVEHYFPNASAEERLDLVEHNCKLSPPNSGIQKLKLGNQTIASSCCDNHPCAGLISHQSHSTSPKSQGANSEEQSCDPQVFIGVWILTAFGSGSKSTPLQKYSFL